MTSDHPVTASLRGLQTRVILVRGTFIPLASAGVVKARGCDVEMFFTTGTGGVGRRAVVGSLNYEDCFVRLTANIGSSLNHPALSTA